MGEDLKFILTIVCSGASLLFVQFLIQRHDSKKDKTDELKKVIEDGLKERDEIGKQRFEENSQAFQELRKAVTELAKSNTEKNKVNEANSELLVAMAQDRIVYLTDKYIKRGVKTIDEMAIVESIYKPYSKLGGNGRAKAGVEACRKIPFASQRLKMWE